jgi:hypothetical protein
MNAQMNEQIQSIGGEAMMGKLKHMDKDLSQHYILHHKSHMNQSGNEPKSP